MSAVERMLDGNTGPVFPSSASARFDVHDPEELEPLNRRPPSASWTATPFRNSKDRLVARSVDQGFRVFHQQLTPPRMPRRRLRGPTEHL